MAGVPTIAGRRVRIEDDTVLQGFADTLDFETGITATVSGSRATINVTSGGGGSVTSVAGGVGITNTPEPITGSGTVDLDINSLTTEPSPATGDFIPFLDISVGTSPSAQRKMTITALAALIGSGGGTVTSVAGGVGITNTPEPIIGAGTVDLDINSLTTETVPVSGDLFAFVDVSVGTSPSSQRKVALSDLATAIGGLPNLAQYVYRPGRTTTTNDFTISTSGSAGGTIQGSTLTGGIGDLSLKSNADATSQIRMHSGGYFMIGPDATPSAASVVIGDPSGSAFISLAPGAISDTLVGQGTAGHHFTITAGAGTGSVRLNGSETLFGIAGTPNGFLLRAGREITSVAQCDCLAVDFPDTTTVIGEGGIQLVTLGTFTAYPTWQLSNVAAGSYSFTLVDSEFTLKSAVGKTQSVFFNGMLLDQTITANGASSILNAVGSGTVADRSLYNEAGGGALHLTTYRVFYAAPTFTIAAPTGNEDFRALDIAPTIPAGFGSAIGILIGSLTNATTNISLRSTGTSRMAHAGPAVFGADAAPTGVSVGLELQSTTLAFLPSVLTTTQRNALTAVDGMIIYNSTAATHQARKSGAWVDVPGTAGGSGTVTSIAGGVGITNTPEPITTTGTVDLDINSLTTETVPVSGDLFAFVDVSVGTAPSAQRKVALSDLATAINGLIGGAYLLLAGRTTTTNDPIISTSGAQGGTIVGSTVAAAPLNHKSGTASNPGMHRFGTNITSITGGFFTNVGSVGGGIALASGDSFFDFAAGWDGTTYENRTVTGTVTTTGGSAFADLRQVTAVSGPNVKLGQWRGLDFQPVIRGNTGITMTFTDVACVRDGTSYSANGGTMGAISHHYTVFSTPSFVTGMTGSRIMCDFGPASGQDNIDAIGMELTTQTAATLTGIHCDFTSGTNRRFIKHDGAAISYMVGGLRIGDTTSPTEKLEVNGNIKIDNSGGAGNGSYLAALDLNLRAGSAATPSPIVTQGHVTSIPATLVSVANNDWNAATVATTSGFLAEVATGLAKDGSAADVLLKTGGEKLVRTGYGDYRTYQKNSGLGGETGATIVHPDITQWKGYSSEVVFKSATGSVVNVSAIDVFTDTNSFSLNSGTINHLDRYNSFRCQPTFGAGVFTAGVAPVIGFEFAPVSVPDAGQVIALEIAFVTGGLYYKGITSAITNAAGTNRFIESTGNAPSTHVGTLRVGDTTVATQVLEVSGNEMITGFLAGSAGLNLQGNTGAAGTTRNDITTGDRLVLNGTYKTGSGTVGVVDTTVTGTSTLFLTEVQPGDTLLIDPTGTPFRMLVGTVANDTSLVTREGSPSTISGKGYRIYKPQIYGLRPDDANKQSFLLTAGGEIQVGHQAGTATRPASPHAYFAIDQPNGPALGTTDNARNLQNAFFVKGGKGSSRATDGGGIGSGVGAATSLTAGFGGDAVGSDTAGAGGNWSDGAGSGGNLTAAAGGTAGKGGDRIIGAGAGGNSSASGTNGAGGSISLSCGAPGTGAGARGLAGNVNVNPNAITAVAAGNFDVFKIANGGVTKDFSGATDTLNIIEFSGTITEDQAAAAGASAMIQSYYDVHIHQNSGTIASMCADQSYYSGPTMQNNTTTNVTTGPTYAALVGFPTFKTTTTGNLTSLYGAAVLSKATLNAAGSSTVTLTTWRGLWQQDAVITGAGTKTLTNQIGLDVDAITSGANNLAVRAQAACIATYLVASYTVQTGMYHNYAKRLQMASTNRAKVQGTARIRGN